MKRNEIRKCKTEQNFREIYINSFVIMTFSKVITKMRFLLNMCPVFVSIVEGKYGNNEFSISII